LPTVLLRHVTTRVLLWSSVLLLMFLIARLRGIASGAFAGLLLIMHSRFVITLLRHN
jgi:hypothetical protein